MKQVSNLVKFEDKTTERMQLEAEYYISSISRLYNGYEVCLDKFTSEISHCLIRLDEDKMDMHDLEYLAAVCIALRREMVLKGKKFV